MPTRAAVLSIGDELTLGQVAESNAQWISQQALRLGILVSEHRTVDDDRQAIAQAIAQLAADFAVVIVTGGLGPTDDDLTREALADAMGGVVLVEDVRARETLLRRFADRGRVMPAMNAKQALAPLGAICVENQSGTAPGLMALIGRSQIFCLPGPPNEMRPMFERVVAPQLAAAGTPRESVKTCAIHSCGLPESVAAELIRSHMARDSNPLAGTTASGAIVTARVRAVGEAAQDGRFEEVCGAIEKAWSPFVFGRDETTLAEALGAVLLQSADRVATAESCTGGGLAQLMTSAPGSSRWFAGGWITYSNELKRTQLGVPEELLGAYGAVSAEVACAMATGAAHRAGVRYGVSTTGIAGPDGGTAQKPVGTVWIAVADRSKEDPSEQVRARRFLLSGDRATVRDRSVRIAAQLVRLTALGKGDVPVLWEVASRAATVVDGAS